MLDMITTGNVYFLFGKLLNETEGRTVVILGGAI